ncbi:LOW QUALITY PROTEIN: hypothetical protein Cgig2_013210 [Carnegiea gigantea]|uniref:Uncharacterized protein n=1 Tax=Carnegiea gigantea TaxID=171969 RepID=A0A9Q1QM64_9CARY|nr:LOW QUALITY PROTEIN: hypothetical protein Cgig2_013210 [Carnegiea gigantea]
MHAALLIALLPSLGHLFGPRGYLRFGYGDCFPQLVLKVLPLSLSTIFLFFHLLQSPLKPEHLPFQLAALRRGFDPPGEGLGRISSSITFGRSEELEVAMSQDLTKSWIRENLAVGSALMKLMVLGGQGCGPPRTGFPCAQGWTGHLAYPQHVGTLMPQFHQHGIQFAGVCEQKGSPQASFHGALEWMPVQRKTNLVKHQPRIVTNKEERSSGSYLFSLLIHQAPSFLLPSALGIHCHLFRGGVLDLQDRQLRPCLLCIKQKRSLVKTK